MTHVLELELVADKASSDRHTSFQGLPLTTHASPRENPGTHEGRPPCFALVSLMSRSIAFKLVSDPSEAV